MRTLLALPVLALLLACNRPDDTAPVVPDEKEELSGGELGTIADHSTNAFGRQVPGLTTTEQTAFVVGNSFFRSNWVAAPASASARDGLGPIMNAVSCGACHPQDGRGLAPAAGEDPLGVLLRIGGADGSHDPVYGDQFQNRAIPGVLPEGRAVVSYETVTIEDPHGGTIELRRPRYALENLNYGPAQAGLLISPRVGMQLPGLGLLEAVPAEVIAAAEDPDDKDGDGVSGRAAWIVGPDGRRLGRFGWKASQPTVAEQAGAAFANDMGITTPNFRHDAMTAAQKARFPNVPHGGDPEISDENFAAVTLYLQALAVPARRNIRTDEIVAGKALFMQLGCQKCHTPVMATGAAALKQLTNQTIRPYTDMLLHDMGEDLADHRPEGAATGLEWRTPPLWGLGLVPTVSGRADLLHDGRARTTEEAILWHGGEAQRARDGYLNLKPADRQRLQAFLQSL